MDGLRKWKVWKAKTGRPQRTNLAGHWWWMDGEWGSKRFKMNGLRKWTIRGIKNRTVWIAKTGRPQGRNLTVLTDECRQFVHFKDRPLSALWHVQLRPHFMLGKPKHDNRSTTSTVSKIRHQHRCFSSKRTNYKWQILNKGENEQWKSEKLLTKWYGALVFQFPSFCISIFVFRQLHNPVWGQIS